MAVDTTGACGSNKPLIISGSNQGVIQSPNYPNDYPSRSDCAWLIEIQNGTRLTIDIVDMRTEVG